MNRVKSISEWRPENFWNSTSLSSSTPDKHLHDFMDPSLLGTAWSFSLYVAKCLSPHWWINWVINSSNISFINTWKLITKITETSGRIPYQLQSQDWEGPRTKLPVPNVGRTPSKSGKDPVPKLGKSPYRTTQSQLQSDPIQYWEGPRTRPGNIFWKWCLINQ